jgi:hypothetical protein
MFSGNTPDPYYAQSVLLDSGQTVNVDLALPTINNTGFSVSGVVIDSVYGTPLDKGVVIIRKGTHTPTLLKQNPLAVDSSVYAGFVKSDGSYSINVEESAYYFVQGYSDYFLPTYFNSQNAASVYWQNADSVFVNQTLNNKNLYLERDSLTNNQLYSYNFGKDDGRFYVSNLPYGSYQLVAQKVGFPNAVSNNFTISPQNQNQHQLNIQFTLTDVEQADNFIPTEIKLYPNYPNPFNPSTIISFSLPASQIVNIKVYNILGEVVADIGNQIFTAGLNEVNFNALGLASGVYIVSLEANSIQLSQKIALMK